MWERITEKRNEGGFTLIELLIVIIILAILAAIVVFAVGTKGSNPKTAACSSDAKTFETALESYKAEVGNYPGEGDGSAAPTGSSNEYGLLGNTTAGAPSPAPNWLLGSQTIGPFMRALPATQHYQIVTDGNGNVYVLPAFANMLSSLGPTVGAADTAALAANSGNPRVQDVSKLSGASSDTTLLNFDANQTSPNGPPCADTSLVS